MAAALLVAATLAVQPGPAYADRTRDSQWHLRFLNVAEAHRHSQGEGVTIAVIDTGVNANHPDLRGNVRAGTDTRSGGGGGDGRQDTHGHGTQMAGLIAGHGHGSADGALGLAPRATILPVRETDRFGFGSDAGAVAGIDWAIANGADVISISRSGSVTPTLRAAVARALAADVVVVAAAGNRPADVFVGAAAAVDGVVAAGATGRTGNHAPVSVTGPQLVLSAPGVDITSTDRTGGYATNTGTSASTAIIAGAVALVRARFPDLPGPEVVRRLTATATDKGQPGRDDQYGFGVLNLVAALTADIPAAGVPSSAAATAPTLPSPSRTAGAAASPAEPGSPAGATTAIITGVVLFALLAAGVLAWLLLARRRPG